MMWQQMRRARREWKTLESLESSNFRDFGNTNNWPNVVKEKGLTAPHTDFETAVLDHIAAGHTANAVYDGPNPVTIIGKNGGGYFHQLIVTKGATLESLTIERLEIRTAREVSISQCKIKRFDIQPSARTNLTVTNSTIGTLHIETVSVDTAKFRNSSLLNIECPGPDGQNPFIGSISFSNLFIPRRKEGFPIQGPQPYRNVRAHLSKLHNTPAVSLFHSAELGLEREDETGLAYVLNSLYGICSDYGQSLWRPIASAALSVVVSALLIWVLGGAVTSEENLVGVHAPYSQAADAWPGWENARRSLSLAFQSGLSPFTLFSARQIWVPANILVLIVTFLQSIFFIACIAMLLVALRRRFKMSSGNS